MSERKCLKKARHSSYAKNKYPALEDVTLYYFSQQRFFYRFYSMVRITCLSQFIFWGWMACFQIRKRSQEKILVVSSSSSNPGVSRKIDSHFMVRRVLLPWFASAAALMVFPPSLYGLRTVNRLILQGDNLMVVTHTPLGGTRSATVPISDVSCPGRSRFRTECLVHLKLKGHRFSFLLDRDGEFVQPTLFDETVGIERF